MKFACLLVLSVFLVACQSLTGKTSSIPEWWSAPQEDTSEWLFGLGEGRTLNAANQQALANVAGKLQTNISGSLSSRTQETNISSSNYVDRRMSSEIEKVSLSNFETLKTESISGKVFTLIRVDKQALSDTWLRQYQTIENDFNSLAAKDKTKRFQWWLSAQAFKTKAAEGDRLASLISGLTETPKSSNLTQKLQLLIEKNTPSVKLSGSHPEIDRVIQSDLLAQGLRLGSCSRDCDLAIQYKTSFSSSTLFGESVVKMSFSGTLTDVSGDFSSSHWSVNASSVSGMAAGKKGTLSIATQRIKSEGLWQSFGMETK